MANPFILMDVDQNYIHNKRTAGIHMNSYSDIQIENIEFDFVQQFRVTYTCTLLKEEIIRPPIKKAAGWFIKANEW